MNESQSQATLQLLERIALALEQIALELPTTQDGQQPQTGRPITASENIAQWVCPIHGSWKMVPAGVSRTKKDANGQPLRYSAFMACAAAGCNERPPRFAVLP